MLSPPARTQRLMLTTVAVVVNTKQSHHHLIASSISEFTPDRHALGEHVLPTRSLTLPHKHRLLWACGATAFASSWAAAPNERLRAAATRQVFQVNKKSMSRYMLTTMQRQHGKHNTSEDRNTSAKRRRQLLSWRRFQQKQH